MNTTHKPAAILFDFGGTLDADGVAWKDRFRRLWCEEVGEIASTQFDPVFYAVDDALVGTIPATTSFYDTVEKIARGVSLEMGRFDDVVGARIAKRFVDESLERLRGNVLVLRDLSRRYRLGIVSNFYGNLSAICREVGLTPVPRDSHRFDSGGGVQAESGNLSRGLAGAPDRTGTGRVRGRLPSAGHGGRSGCRNGPCVAHAETGSRKQSLLSKRSGGSWDGRGEGLVRMTQGATIRGGIIAAGEGSRLRQAGYAVPKPLVPVAGMPLIGRIIDNFLAAGIRSLVIIFNEEGRECERWVRSHYADLDIDIILKTTASSLESFLTVAERIKEGPAPHFHGGCLVFAG